MSVELVDQYADDAEEVIIAWLSALGSTAAYRQPGDPLPFRVVHRVAGSDDVDGGVDRPIVSVHTFCAADAGMAAAATHAQSTHRRMLYLAHHSVDITLTDDRIANVDYLDVVESPTWQEYGDNTVLRKVARYAVGLGYITVPQGS